MNWDIILVACIAALPGLLAAWLARGNKRALHDIKVEVNGRLGELLQINADAGNAINLAQERAQKLLDAAATHAATLLELAALKAREKV